MTQCNLNTNIKINKWCHQKSHVQCSSFLSLNWLLGFPQLAAVTLCTCNLKHINFHIGHMCIRSISVEDSEVLAQDSLWKAKSNVCFQTNSCRLTSLTFKLQKHQFKPFKGFTVGSCMIEELLIWKKLCWRFNRSLSGRQRRSIQSKTLAKLFLFFSELKLVSVNLLLC